MNKIIVRNTSIVINDYMYGDCPKLERFFAVYDPITHAYNYVGIYYDAENKRLYLPRGIDIWYVEQLLDCKAYIEKDVYNPFDSYKNILMKYVPRDEDQKQALRFTCGKGEYIETKTKSQLCVNLNTGKGKTYVAIGTMSVTGLKSIIITYSKYILNQWKDRILEYTNIEDKEIVTIEGSGTIFRLLQRSPKDILKIKVFLVTHSTIQLYGETYGWDKVTELFQYLRVGMKVYDEAHTNFDNMCKIDYFTNVYKSYYLTATPARSNTNENNIYQTAFKNVLAIDLFHEDTDPHTHYIAMRYNSRPTPQIISYCRNKYGLDRMKYINYIVDNENFQMMAKVVLNFIFTKICKNPEDKIIIYIGTNNAIAKFNSWIIENFQFLSGKIGVFSSLVDDEEKAIAINKQVILTTTKSAGAAVDIKGLKCTLVLAEPFKSEVLARQTLGRTRSDNTYYIEVVDKGFRQCNKYFLDKRPIFIKYALDCKIVEFDQVKLNDMYNKIVKMEKSIGMQSTLIRPFYRDGIPLTKPFTINPHG